MIKKWVLRNIKTGAYLQNGFTKKDMMFESRGQAEHYIHCFGDVTFVGNKTEDWVAHWSGEFMTCDEFCKEVEKSSKDLEKLDMLKDYLMEFKKKYSLVNLDFMSGFLKDKIEREMNRKKKNLEASPMFKFFNGLFGGDE